MQCRLCAAAANLQSLRHTSVGAASPTQVALYSPRCTIGAAVGEARVVPCSFEVSGTAYQARPIRRHCGFEHVHHEPAGWLHPPPLSHPDQTCITAAWPCC